MTPAGCVAVVSPREERRNSARAWAPLLKGRAEIRLGATPEEARDAQVIALDDACPDAGGWARRWADGNEHATVVRFSGPDGEASRVLRWGEDGEEVLAVICDLLDRRALLGESDALLESLRASGDQLEGHRRRLAALAASPGPPDDRAALARDVERLTRLATIARFLAAPGPESGFTPGLTEVLSRALATSAVSVARYERGAWLLEGRRRLARRAALAILPPPGEADRIRVGVPCASRAGEGFWIPLAGDPPLGLVGVTREGQGPAELFGVEGLTELQALLADAMNARAATRAVLQRQTQSERVVQTLRSGLLKVDASERILLVNPALAAMLQSVPAQMEGRALADAFARDPHVVEMLRAALVRGEGLDDVETFVTATGGRRVAVSLRASALGEEGGRIDGILVLLSDLARRKELEEEIRKAERLAALGRLSAGVAHEIRNPLAGIRTTTEILRGRLEGNAELTRFADVILEETERLDRIVGSLLQFAKPASPRRAPVRVGELLERAVRLAAGRAAEVGVTLRKSEAPDLPSVPADRDQLLQVLLNLLLNAVDATPSGGEVVVHADIDAHELRLVVEDGGEGIPPTLRDRVFDPFFTTKPGGTGLGLSISQNILRQHGGRLRLDRPENGRSRVVATLPLRPVEPPSAQPGGATWRTS